MSKGGRDEGFNTSWKPVLLMSILKKKTKMTIFLFNENVPKIIKMKL